MRTGVLALGIAGGLAACGPALAQMQGVPNVSNQRQMNISGDVNLTYDSNVSRSSPEVARLRGIHPEDGIVNPTAVFQIVQPIGRNAAFLQGHAGYEYHLENSRLDHVNADVAGGGLLSTGPCRTTALGHYTVAQSELIDAALTVSHNVMETAVGGGQITCGQSRGFNIQLQGDHSDVVNSESRQKTADHRADQIGVQIGYANQTLGNLSLVGSYNQAEYPSRLNAHGTFGDSYWNELLGVNYQRQLGSKIKVQAMVAQSIVKRDSAPPGIPLKVRNTNYSAAIDYKVSSRLELTLTGTRLFQPSNRPGKLVDLVTHTEVKAVYDIGTRFTVTLGGFLEDMKTNKDTSPNALPTISRSRLTGESLEVHYRQSRRFGGRLDVRHEDRDTDLPQFNYSDTRVTVTLSSSF